MAVNLSMLAGAGAQFFDNSGVPLNGGLVYTYAAGTTTPQAAYTSSAGNTAHTNPIVLNSAGRVAAGGEIWLTDAVAYKFVLETSAAVTIATYDNVTGNASGIYAAFAASSGSALVGYLSAGTGAVATTVQAKLRETVSVKDFGAIGNGTTDDTAAIQAAITSISSNGGIVRFAVGSYKLTAGLTVPKLVSLIGDVEGTWTGSAYAGGVALLAKFSGDVITLNGTVGRDSDNIFENITILGDKATYPTGNGFVLSNAINVITRRCRVLNIAGHGFVTGDLTGNSYHNYYYNCYSLGAGGSGYEVRSDWVRIIDSWADTCAIGVNFPTTSPVADHGKIIRCHFEEQEQAAIKISGAASRQGGHIIEDCTIYSRRYVLANPGYGIWFDTSISAAGCTGTLVIGNSLTCNTNYVANTNTHGIEIGNGAAGNTFIANNITSFYVNINMGTGCSGTVFTDNFITGYQSNTDQNTVVGTASVWKGNNFVNSTGTYSMSASGVVLQLVANIFDKLPNCSLNSQITSNVGYVGGTWVPTFTNLTVVNGTGGATYSGKYRIEGNMAFFNVAITVTGSCTTSSAGSSTFFGGMPYSGSPSIYPFTANFASGVTIIGSGIVSGSNGYCPAWAATNSTVQIYGYTMLS